MVWAEEAFGGELRHQKVFGFFFFNTGQVINDPVRSSWAKVFPVKKLLHIMASWELSGYKILLT